MAPYPPHAVDRASRPERKIWLCRDFAEPSDGLEPSTPPYHGSLDASRAYTRGARATRFRLEIRPFWALGMRRETSRVSFLMCPFCVRAQLLCETTDAGSRRRACLDAHNAMVRGAYPNLGVCEKPFRTRTGDPSFPSKFRPVAASSDESPRSDRPNDG